ncbi:acyl carrier protein [Nocardia sp. NPDC056000]|uniref:acyl carrier protein n=1 Tax=Nocardia sp. NPDC056000 TaxID=3345674 RepID=UPI0035E0A439
MSQDIDIHDELVKVVREDLASDIVDIDESSRLIDDLGLDSVAFAIAIVAIEERMGVRLSERELLECRTVGDIAALVRTHREALAASTAETGSRS